MEWYYWVIIIVLALIIIGQFVGAYYGFRYIIPMKPQSDSLLNRDLDNSKFQKHKEKIIENILFMQEKEYVDVYITSKDNENTGFGTYNSDGAKELFDFSKDIFSAIQLGPCGKTKLSDSSPYTGTVFSKNPLFINLKELTTAKWDKILSQKTLDKIIEEIMKVALTRF